MTNRNTSPAGKGKRGLIIVLIAANLLMLVVGIITIPPNLQGAVKKAGPSVAVASASPIATRKPEPANASPQVDTPQSHATEAPPVELSTDERPNLEDFLWYTEDVLYNGVPTGAETIDHLSPLIGGWKALIIYDPDNVYDSNAYEFLNIALSGTEDDLSLTLDWYLIYWSNEGESLDETGMEDTVFSGKWENGGLWASGAGTIRLTHYYEQNQKQYAVGTMDTPDGIPAFVALVRP